MARSTGGLIRKRPLAAATAPKRQIFPLQNFAGGLNTRWLPTQLADNESPDCQNVHFATAGAITKRNGYTRWNANSTGAHAVAGIYRFSLSQGGSSFLLMADAAGNVYSGSAGVWTQIGAMASAGPAVNFVTYSNECIMVNGGAPYKWNGQTYTTGTVAVTNGSATVTGTGTSWSGTLGQGGAITIGGVVYLVASVASNTSLTLASNYAGSTASGLTYSATTFQPLGGNPPNAALIAVMHNYVYLVGSNRSQLWFSDLENPDSWPALNFVYVSVDDGDNLTALMPHVDQLILFKSQRTWALYGTGPDNWQIRFAVGFVGAINQGSVAAVRGELIFLSRRGVYAFDGGTRFTYLSERIEPTIASLNYNAIAGASAAFYKDQYWLSVPGAGAGSDSLILMMQVPEDKNVPWAWTKYTIPASALYTDPAPGGDVLYSGDGAAGIVYTQDSGQTDNGTAIDAYWLSKPLDFGAPQSQKRFMRCWVAFATTTDPVTLDVQILFDGGQSQQNITVPLQAQGSLWGTAQWGSANWSGGGYVVERSFVVGQLATYAALRIENPQALAPFVVAASAFEYTVMPPH